MDAQTLINVAFTLAGALASWVLKFLYDGLKSLRQTDDALATKVQAIELLVAGQYIKRDDMERYLDKQTALLFQRFDSLEKKLDNKVDK